MGDTNTDSSKKLSVNIKQFVLKYGALYSAIAALISDVIKPLFEFTFLFLVISITLLAVEIMLGAYSVTSTGKNINKRLADISGGYWIKPIFFATLLSFLILLATYMLNNDSEGGFLSEHSEAVKTLQGKLGAIQKIGEETKAEIKKLKKETSEDPRKELVNLGIKWGDRGYYQAIKDHDLRILKLFWEGGMNPYYKFEDSDQPILFYHIFFGKDDWQGLVKTFVNNSQIDLANDKFTPAKWMFLNIPRSNISFDVVVLQDYISKEPLTFGQILFCSKMTFKMEDDIRLFNELVAMGADRNQLIDILDRIKKALDSRYGNEFTPYNLSSRSSLRRVKAAIQYLPDLENNLKNTQ